MPRASASGCGTTGDGSPVVGTVVTITSSTSCRYCSSGTPSSSFRASPLCSPKAGDGPCMCQRTLGELVRTAQEHPLAQLALRRVMRPLQEVAALVMRVVVDVAPGQHRSRRRCPQLAARASCRTGRGSRSKPILSRPARRGSPAAPATTGTAHPTPVPAVPSPGTATATGRRHPPTA